jgi:biotin transport system substrate-specific component
MVKTEQARGRKSLTGLTLTALFGALIAAGTFVSIPLPFSPVPIVLQNLFAVLAGLVLGPLWGGAAAALYLAAGALGAPVFAGAVGGAAHFAGPTGGFLLGYLLAALAAGLAAGRPRAGMATPLWRIILAAAAGFAAVYVPGVPWLKMILKTDWPRAFAAGCLPFLIGDGIKAAAAVLAASRLRRAVGDLLDR